MKVDHLRTERNRSVASSKERDEAASARSPDTARGKPAPRGAALPRADVTAALRRAFFREWAESGYAALRMERVAARAGVGKAALYRRWKSKGAMATALVEGLATSLVPVPDTGSLAGDVRAFQRSLARVLRHRTVHRILPDLHAEGARSPELARLLRTVTTSRRERGLAILDRATARGELAPDVDRELALDLMAAPIYWRVIATGGRLEEEDLEANTRAFLRAVSAPRMR